MPTRAIVFDFDGVIVDSEPAHCAGIEAALADLGLPFPGKHTYGRYIGRGDRECFLEVAKEQGRTLSAPDLDRLVSRKAQEFLRAAKSGEILPFAATVSLLLASADRVPVGVCSGSLRHSVEPVLKSLGLLDHLSALVTATEAARNKPDPAPYLLAAERLGLDPAHCIAIEDSPTGIRSARAAGYTVHALCHSFACEHLGEAHHVHDSSAVLNLDELLDGPRALR